MDTSRIVVWLVSTLISFCCLIASSTLRDARRHSNNPEDVARYRAHVASGLSWFVLATMVFMVVAVHLLAR